MLEYIQFATSHEFAERIKPGESIFCVSSGKQNRIEVILSKVNKDDDVQFSGFVTELEHGHGYAK